MVLFSYHVCSLQQIVVWRFLHGRGSEVLATKQALLFIVWFQLLPRFIRLLALNSDLKKSAGSFAESAWAGAAYYLLWFLLAAQVSITLVLHKHTVLLHNSSPSWFAV